MMRTFMKVSLISVGLAGAIVTPALAASFNDPHWPCIQRKVPEITAGIVWSGPELPEDGSAWRKDETIKAIVDQLAQRRLTLEDAMTEIDKFAGTLVSERTEKLALVFSGLLDTINKERRSIMSGIERYAKRQLALAETINESRHKLVELLKLDDLSDDQIKQRDELEERLSWDTRIFDERQQSLTYVCEAPVLLEQRLFALGRKLLEHVE